MNGEVYEGISFTALYSKNKRMGRTKSLQEKQSSDPKQD